MRTRFVAGNWKMNGTLVSARALAAGVAADARDIAQTEVVLCPPFPHLQAVAEILTGTGIGLGGQNVHAHADGAFTGEVSATMLSDCGCRHAIVGHSERRALLAESDLHVAEKVVCLLEHGLVPIVCVGESLQERESGATESVVARQLDAVLKHVGPGMLPLAVIAYEPVWAIGTGRTASPDQAQEVHAFIRRLLVDAAPDAATRTRIVYGGSVKPDNASSLFAMPDIDGGLIGGAALSADSFLAICKAP